MHKSYDIVIVGGRIAGCSLAIQLAIAGLSVLILDKENLPADKPYSTHLIGLNGVQILKELNLFDTIVNTGCPVYERIVLHTPVGSIAGNPPPYKGNTHFFGPRRFALDTALYEEAERLGVVIRSSCEAIEAIWDEGRVIGVRCKTKSSNSIDQYLCRLLVGADGANSKVAKLVESKTYSFRQKLSGILWAYFKDLQLDEMEFYFGYGVSGVCFSTNNDLSMVTLTTTLKDYFTIQKNPEAKFFAKLDAGHKELARKARQATLVGDIKGCSVANVLRESSGCGWALIGDAACLHDPASASGISDALTGAKLLAKHVMESWKGNNHEFDKALSDYSSEYDVKIRPYFDYWCNSLEYYFEEYKPDAHSYEIQDRFWQFLEKNEDAKISFMGILAHSYDGDSQAMWEAVSNAAAVE